MSALVYFFATKSTTACPGARQKAGQRVGQIPKILDQGGESKSVDSTPINTEFLRADCAGSPSRESTVDPAATRHAPYTEKQRVTEKSKYEPS